MSIASPLDHAKQIFWNTSETSIKRVWLEIKYIIPRILFIHVSLHLLDPLVNTLLCQPPIE